MYLEIAMSPLPANKQSIKNPTTKKSINIKGKIQINYKYT